MVQSPQHYVHLVGSILLSYSYQVFRSLAAALPTQLRYLPDGETGERWKFARWQETRISPITSMSKTWTNSYAKSQDHIPEVLTPEQAAEIVASLPPIDTGYDTEALKSCAEFKGLKEAGVIQRDVRFQVCVPTPVNVIAMHLRAEVKPRMEPVYTDALLCAQRRIQEEIPHNELAIQFDCAIEFAILEGVLSSWLDPWFPATIEEVSKRVATMVDEVDGDAPVGLHECYGDINGVHFTSIKDTGLMVDVALAVIEKAKRKIDWIHMPVEAKRTDKEYFAPLKRLAPKMQEHGTDLVLGVIQPFDLEGTMERMRAAKSVVERFGISTECGLGRYSLREDRRGALESVLAIAAAVSGSI